MKNDIPVQITGLGIPLPVDDITDVVLNETIIKTFTYPELTQLQRYALPVLSVGHNLMACAPSGSGKTAAFCLPIISEVMKTTCSKSRASFAFPVALILCPTETLALQVFNEAKTFCHKTQVKVTYGGAVCYDQVREKTEDVDILVATPKQIQMMIDEEKDDKPSVALKDIKYLALDKADQMLTDANHQDIRRIVDLSDMPSASERQTMIFSATFPPKIQRRASGYLYNNNNNSNKSSYIFLSVGRVGSSKCDFWDFRNKSDYGSEYYNAIDSYGGATSGG
ncbi:helicase Cas3, CRISPR-associated, core [Artemisia annua]|uniref:Helicase Cas3, CRISPR-associated, core n=1 Tax=Artemisia annua TaxID=35608 RepID=A0A2U1Q0G9_ARTAN|nr:helicase Cas3, CRISPR-associated, core [Artemisia annua]